MTTDLQELLDTGEVLWVILDGPPRQVHLMRDTYTAEEVVRLLDILEVGNDN